MTKLRCFNSDGLNLLRTYLNEARAGGSPDFDALAKSDAHTVVWKPEAEVPSIEAESSKLEVGKTLYKLLVPALGQPEDLLKMPQLWSWLSVNWIDVLAPADSLGHRNVKSDYRWIPEVGEFRTYYRHPLALPFRVIWQFQDRPEDCAVLLTGALNKPGEMTEQLASNQEIFGSKTLLAAATKLYVDSKTGTLRPGAAGKTTPGSARRFSAVVGQLGRTWDLNAMPPQRIIEMLPNEFDGFKSN